jgi:hypothetical protein
MLEIRASKADIGLAGRDVNGQRPFLRNIGVDRDDFNRPFLWCRPAVLVTSGARPSLEYTYRESGFRCMIPYVSVDMYTSIAIWSVGEGRDGLARCRT